MRRREFVVAAVSGLLGVDALEFATAEAFTGTSAPKPQRPAKGPLRLHPRNPRYFTDGSGKVVYLTGSHTWTNFQDGDERKTPFNFNAYLDFLVQHNHNFIRLWSWQSTGAWIFPAISPHPWERTGPGLARDGKPKFNLHRFNQAYFDRLRSRVLAAQQRGIYVSVMFFVGGNVDVPDEWERHPFHRDNNVNGIDGDVDGDGKGSETMTMSDHPRVNAVRKLQLAYVRKVIDTLNDLDNVLFEIVNEGGSREWDWFLVNFIHEYEKSKPKQHPVGLTGHGRESNEEMLASPADWFSPGAREWPDLRTDPRPVEARWRKVSILDTDHLWGEGGDYRWVWKSFLRGHNPIYMDRIAALTGDNRGDIPGAEEVRKAMGHTRTMAERINLAEMEPHPELVSTTYCLAQPGKDYLVYLPDGGEVTVNLSAALGTMKVEWTHPVTGKLVMGGTTQGGAERKFTSPFSGDAVLRIYK